MKSPWQTLSFIVLTMLLTLTASHAQNEGKRLGKMAVTFDSQGPIEFAQQTAENYLRSVGMTVKRDGLRISATSERDKVSVYVNCDPAVNKISVIAYAPEQQKAEMIASLTSQVIKGVKPKSPQKPPSTPSKVPEQTIDYDPQSQDRNSNDTSLTFIFKTAVATAPKVEVSSRAPRDGRFDSVLRSVPGPSNTVHRITVDGLKSLKSYYFIITAPGAPGTASATYSSQRSTSGRFD